MNEYVIMTDSACDMPDTLAREMRVEVLPLSVMIGGKSYKHYLDCRELDCHDFYEQLRAKESATTSAANISDIMDFMEPFLLQGKDVLYLAFSSALSSTFDAARQAVAELSEKYPERRIYVLDSKCASLGQGLFVYLAAREAMLGKSIDEVKAYAEKICLHICHWFTVEDLGHLKRGGRVSAVTAAFGTVLDIKPVLHVDDLGRLINVEKARGRKKSVKMLADKMEALWQPKEEATVFLSHGDCPEEANAFAEELKARFHLKEVLVNPIGPVIGAHSGPGTMALFFYGDVR